MNQTTFCPSCRHTDELLIVNRGRLSHCIQCGLEAPASFFTTEQDEQVVLRTVSIAEVECRLTSQGYSSLNKLAPGTYGRIVKLLACAPGRLEDWALLEYATAQTWWEVHCRIAQTCGPRQRWVFVNNGDPRLVACFKLAEYPSAAYVMTVTPYPHQEPV